MASSSDTHSESFAWTPQPPAAALIDRLLGDALSRCSALARLAERMQTETGTRLADWIDHVALPAPDTLEAELAEVGFEAAEESARKVWTHARGLFPAVLTGGEQVTKVAIKTESVVDFLVAQQVEGAEIEGDPLASVRMARVAAEDGVEVWAIERHGAAGFDAGEISADRAAAVLRHAEALRCRRRTFDDDAAGFDHALGLIRAAKDELGVDRACDLFFAAERGYWQNRNHAARVQKSRQDRLGLGWANHDHHTYRSSREHFTRLIGALEELGFVCRERFYAGQEAGWGAQVLEQPACGIVIFADVDLAPDEVASDFAHELLPSRDSLGTVGLWCKLHGEAFLQAGMHHLECQFDFLKAQQQLRAAGVETMAPFTDFPHLKQAFTAGEVWPVSDQRIEAALADGLITTEQAAVFRQHGAVGSHLEILQRDQGYKGFNQSGVSDIIRKTDPRTCTAGS